jgi:putative transposase
MHQYITRAQFNLFSKQLLVKSKRPRVYDIYDIVNAILHILITGSQWRNLPNCYPPFKNVFYHYSKWRKSKSFHKALIRIQGKNCIKPRALVIDTQSVSDSDMPSLKSKGYDGHKHRKGVKRCILVDNLGMVRAVKYYRANTSEIDCARNIIDYYKNTPFGKSNKQVIEIYGDKGFHSPILERYLKRKYNINYRPIPRIKKPDLTTKVGYDVWKLQYGYITANCKKIRWVVERTFAWFQKYRRLNMNYERTISSLEAMTILSAIRMQVRRLVD